MKQNILAVVLALLAPVSTFADGGRISSPQLQFPDGATRETIAKVLDYLRSDLTFVEGSFVNEFSSQEFSGSANKVTGLIQLLERSGFELTVNFADLKDDRITLRLSQNTRRRETALVINTAKKDFVLSDLVIHVPASRTRVDHVLQATPVGAGLVVLSRESGVPELGRWALMSQRALTCPKRTGRVASAHARSAADTWISVFLFQS